MGQIITTTIRNACSLHIIKRASTWPGVVARWHASTPSENAAFKAEYTPPRRRRRRDSTVELRHVGGVNAPVGSCDPVINFLCCWAIEVGDKWRHNDVIVEKVINIDQNSRSQTAMESIWSVSKLLSIESVGSRRELVANCVHTADATQLDSRVASASTRLCVLGINWTSAER